MFSAAKSDLDQVTGPGHSWERGFILNEFLDMYIWRQVQQFMTISEQSLKKTNIRSQQDREEVMEKSEA